MARHTELMPFEPSTRMNQVFRDFERLFDTRRGFPFFRPFGPELAELPWIPQLEMKERDHHLIATLDLPGLKKEELSVEAADGTLTISGERKRESEETKNDWFRSERTYGAFYRTIALPEGVSPADIKATFTNGVLELTMPLAAKAAPATTKVAIGEGTPEKAEKTAGKAAA